LLKRQHQPPQVRLQAAARARAQGAWPQSSRFMDQPNQRPGLIDSLRARANCNPSTERFRPRPRDRRYLVPARGVVVFLRSRPARGAHCFGGRNTSTILLKGLTCAPSALTACAYARWFQGQAQHDQRFHVVPQHGVSLWLLTFKAGGGIADRAAREQAHARSSRRPQGAFDHYAVTSTRGEFA
jgi:hypothetical protein